MPEQPQTVGLALHSYHGDNNRLPIGANRSPKRWSWAPQVWPYVEMAAVAAAYDYTNDFYAAPNSNPTQKDGGGKTPAATGPLLAWSPIYNCRPTSPNRGTSRRQQLADPVELRD